VELEIQEKDQHMVIQLAKEAVLNKVDQEVLVLLTSRAHKELPREVEQQQDNVVEKAAVVARYKTTRSIENICRNERRFLIHILASYIVFNKYVASA
jgi:hypothetical protein